MPRGVHRTTSAPDCAAPSAPAVGGGLGGGRGASASVGLPQLANRQACCIAVPRSTHTHELRTYATLQSAPFFTQRHHKLAQALPRMRRWRGGCQRLWAAGTLPARDCGSNGIMPQAAAATGLLEHGKFGARAPSRRCLLPSCRARRRSRLPLRATLFASAWQSARAPAPRHLRAATLPRTRSQGASWPSLPGSHGCRGDGWPAAAPSARNRRHGIA